MIRLRFFFGARGGVKQQVTVYGNWQHEHYVGSMKKLTNSGWFFYIRTTTNFEWSIFVSGQIASSAGAQRIAIQWNGVHHMHVLLNILNLVNTKNWKLRYYVARDWKWLALVDNVWIPRSAFFFPPNLQKSSQKSTKTPAGPFPLLLWPGMMYTIAQCT